MPAVADTQNTITKTFENDQRVFTAIMSQEESREVLEEYWRNVYLRSPLLFDPSGEVSLGLYDMPSTSTPFGRGFVISPDGIVELPRYMYNPDLIVATINEILDDYFGEDAVIVSALSVLPHNGVDWAIDLGDAHAVEPRMGGPRKLLVTLSKPLNAATVDAQNVQVDCGMSEAPAVSLVALDEPEELRLEFADAFLDGSCCWISFDGMKTELGGDIIERVTLVALEGDMDGNRIVTGADALLLKPQLNQVLGADLEEPRWDFNRNGGVSGADILLIKPRLGRAAAACSTQ